MGRLSLLRTLGRNCKIWARPVYACAILLICAPYAPAAPLNKTAPFAPGERLTFALKWSDVPAGRAVMEVLPMETLDGKPAYHFRLSAQSNSFVDVFYKVRDRIESFAAVDMSRALHFFQKKHEGSSRNTITIKFDWLNATAQYSDEDRVKPPIVIKPGTFDPLSIFYYSRTQELKENEILEHPVTDGKKCILGVARVIRREKIEVPCGSFDTFLIEPEMKHIRGVFEKKRGAKIWLWVSADAQRLPIKIVSEVIIGTFVGELVMVEKNAV
jgi:hypothetical protein